MRHPKSKKGYRNSAALGLSKHFLDDLASIHASQIMHENRQKRALLQQSAVNGKNDR